MIKSHRHFACAFLTALLGTSAAAQPPDSRGKEFIAGIADHNYMFSAEIQLLISGDTATTGKAEIPGLGFTASFSVTPGVLTVVKLPFGSMVQTADGKANRGIRVTSSSPIGLTVLTGNYGAAGSFLSLPTEGLGTDYMVLAYTGGFDSPRCTTELLVVATQNGTQVTITPSATTQGRTGGVPYQIALNRLETYQLKAGWREDLSGTAVKSDKPVAVYGGASCTQVPQRAGAKDHIIEQMTPTATWGRSFFLVPLQSSRGGDIVRILARDNGTTVRLNGGVVATLQRGQFFENDLTTSSPYVIETSAPALVAQYWKGGTFDDNPDPDIPATNGPLMMLITPAEQFLNRYTFGYHQPILADYISSTSLLINLAVRTAEIGNCRLNGLPLSSSNFVPIQTTGLSAAKIRLSSPVGTFTCPSGFGAQGYSFGFDYNPIGFGSSGGTRLKGIAAPRCDANRDGTINAADIAQIYAARNTPASSIEDPNDFDGDMTITVADARGCALRVAR